MKEYFRSMFRHFMAVWTLWDVIQREKWLDVDETKEMVEGLMALLFNVQGFAREFLLLLEAEDGDKFFDPENIRPDEEEGDCLNPACFCTDDASCLDHHARSGEPLHA